MTLERGKAPPERGLSGTCIRAQGITFPGEEALMAGSGVSTYILGAAGHVPWERHAVHQWERRSDG